MCKKKSPLWGLYLFIACTGLYAQKTDTAWFKSRSVILLEQFNTIATLDGKAKQQAETAFRDSLLQVLKTYGSFQYQFDTLRNIGRISSDDNRLRIFSWNVPQKSGYSNYYAILQYCDKKEKDCYVGALYEEPGILKRAPQVTSDTNHWAGALYYRIIDTRYKGKVYYTLLGFNFNDILTNIKTIDVLTFDDSNLPVFAPKMFIYKGKPLNRIVYEYNERVQMMLEYNSSMKKIVADHLSPSRPSMEGQYQFYGPDFSYEGFEFVNGIWQHIPDIDVRN
ncbi:MAG: hypothetical protein JXB34_10180 [Bacteroidales bacterium]|nr:hypothetical protein [Bacteroidales bacterium]